jgi:hypothetical protein
MQPMLTQVPLRNLVRGFELELQLPGDLFRRPSSLESISHIGYQRLIAGQLAKASSPTVRHLMGSHIKVVTA